MIDKVVNWLFGVMTRPVVTLREIAAEKPFGLALAVYCGVTVLNASAALFSSDELDALEQAIPAARILGNPVVLVGIILAISLVSLFVVSGFLHLLARVFGGTGSYQGLFSAYAFAGFPLIIAVPVNYISTYLGLFGSLFSAAVALGLFIWVLVLQIIALRESHGLSTGISILVYLIQFLLFVLIPAALVIAFFVYLFFI